MECFKKNNQQLKDFKYFCKELHLRCLTGFAIRFCIYRKRMFWLYTTPFFPDKFQNVSTALSCLFEDWDRYQQKYLLKFFQMISASLMLLFYLPYCCNAVVILRIKQESIASLKSYLHLPKLLVLFIAMEALQI